MDKEKKDKKLPFNTFRKGIVAGILGLTLGVSAFGLAGCTDGENGKDGTQWLSGTNAPVVSQGVDGDYYLDTASNDLYQKENGSWVLKIENFGSQGENGTNIYVGYDGYVWQDGVKTTFKLDQDEEASKGVVEDTIGAYTTMGYWAGEYVDLSTNTIALMANYKPNAKLTQYSGTKVTEIQVVAESAGTLHIGTAKVADIVTARTNGTTYTATTTSYDVNAGVNTITLDLTVAEDETIVLGGSNSTAKVYVVKNLPVSDEAGNYALVNSTANTDVISKTGDYADTLAVRVKAETESGVALFENVTTDYPATGSNLKAVTGGGYKFTDSSMFEGKTITKIGVAVNNITSSSGEQPYMTVYKVKISVTNNFIENGTAIKIYFPADTQANTWAYANCNIELADDEILVFGAQSGDTLVWSFVYQTSLTGEFLSNAGQPCDNAKLIFDVYAESGDWSEHIESLEEKEQDAISQIQVQSLRGYL